MEERKLIVYYGYGAFKKIVATGFLQRKWLEQVGFSEGDKITMKCQQGQLIITKDELEAYAETGNKINMESSG